MTSFLTIIKSDYLQRTRSYAFLITLCTSLAIAYTFVPEPNAMYSTIRIGEYMGYYNAAWFGYVTAIMTSVFLSLIGFYLINDSIKKDMETKVGQIIASTSITNFKYLFSKVLSNFLVLLTITLIIFMMSILLFFLYNDGFPFDLFQFITPYAFITLPSLFSISVIAVVFEVFFVKYAIIQHIGFFVLFCTLIVFSPKNEAQFSLDIFGSKIVIHHMEEKVQEILQIDTTADLTIGYILKNTKKVKKFHFDGIHFPPLFLVSRLVWILLGIGIIGIISPIFHRFNLKERRSHKKNKKIISTKQQIIKEIVLSNLPKPQVSFGILQLIKVELILLIKKGKKWLWALNIIGMILLMVLPLKMAHQLVLPILWFLQVQRISELTTKEVKNNIHYFAFTSYKPLSRLLSAQVIAGVFLMVLLAIPLCIRYITELNFISVFLILLGGIFLVILSAFLGIIIKNQKLFEVLFFMITYANINKIPFTDYFGGLSHTASYGINLFIITIILGVFLFIARNYQLKK